MKDKIDISFVNTSVEDLESSLRCAEVNGTSMFNSAVLQKVFDEVSRRGEKTMARLIKRYIKKAIKKEKEDGMSATRENVEKLKKSWLADPCWDIEDTEGFEDFRDELVAFHKEQDEKWEKKRFERDIKRGEKVGAWTGIYDIDKAQFLSTPDEIEHELRTLDAWIEKNTEGEALIAREQVRATLLLAAQVQRVAELLGRKIDQDNGDSNLDFMTKLYKVD